MSTLAVFDGNTEKLAPGWPPNLIPTRLFIWEPGRQPELGHTVPTVAFDLGTVCCCQRPVPAAQPWGHWECPLQRLGKGSLLDCARPLGA